MDTSCHTMNSMKSTTFINNFISGYGFKITQIGLNKSQRDDEEAKLRKLGFKECPVCSNKLCSTQLLIEHIKIKHPETKAFTCNICQRKLLRGSERLLLHIEQCHEGSNIMLQENKKLPYIKLASAEEGRNVCDQAGILYCESHGVCFYTNQAAHAHRSSVGTASKPCFLILMRGTVGTNEDINLPKETEDYMKARQEGRYTRKRRGTKQSQDSNGIPTSNDVKNQSNPIPRTLVCQEEWNKHPRIENWEHQIKRENLIQPTNALPVMEDYSYVYDPLYANPQDAMYPTNYSPY